MNISPASSLVGLLFFSFGLSFLNSIELYIFLPLLFLAFTQEYQFKKLLKHLAILNLFILVVVASVLIEKQLQQALLILIRSNAILLMALLLFSQKDIFFIAYGVNTLKLPHKLSSILFFVGKFVFIIKNELAITKKVMKSRNFQKKTDLFTYFTYANAIGMLIIKCFERADKLRKAMELRNFQGEIYQLREEPVTKIDIVFLFLVILSLILSFKGLNV